MRGGEDVFTLGPAQLLIVTNLTDYFAKKRASSSRIR